MVTDSAGRMADATVKSRRNGFGICNPLRYLFSFYYEN